MITDFDDYLIHQAAAPICQPGVTDRNFYDRYWFSGFDRAGTFLFEVGFGRYPHRFVQDGHFSVVVDGVQHCFHVSGRAPSDPKESLVGPLRIEVVRPMRAIRVRLEPNETEIECDLTFRATALPHREPKNTMYDGIRLIMDTQRFTQFGAWEGYFSIAGRRFEASGADVLGSRDKSWGVRPVGEFEEGAPSKLSTDPGVYWVWSAIQFDGFGTLFLTREEPDGYAKELSAAMVKTHSDLEAIAATGDGTGGAVAIMNEASHKIRWQPGTRWPAQAELELGARDGTVHRVELDPLMRFQMMGIGYQHPEWKHAVWRDELDIGYESWKLDEVDPEDYCTIHVHTLVRAKLGDQLGIGTLETLSYGPHQPSGFQDLFGGHAPPT